MHIFRSTTFTSTSFERRDDLVQLRNCIGTKNIKRRKIKGHPPIGWQAPFESDLSCCGRFFEMIHGYSPCISARYARTWSVYTLNCIDRAGARPGTIGIARHSRRSRKIASYLLLDAVSSCASVSRSIATAASPTAAKEPDKYRYLIGAMSTHGPTETSASNITDDAKTLLRPIVKGSR